MPPPPRRRPSSGLSGTEAGLIAFIVSCATLSALLPTNPILDGQALVGVYAAALGYIGGSGGNGPRHERVEIEGKGRIE